MEKPSDVVKKFGPDALNLIESALDHGLSRQFAATTIEKLGPLCLQMLVEYLRQAPAKVTPAQIQELKDKISALVQTKFSGDYKKAFANYANAQGNIDSNGLWYLLKDAGIGNIWDRGYWVTGILGAVDANKDGQISYAELEAILK